MLNKGAVWGAGEDSLEAPDDAFGGGISKRGVGWEGAAELFCTVEDVDEAVKLNKGVGVSFDEA